MHETTEHQVFHELDRLIKKGDLIAVRTWIAGGGNVGARNDYGWTLLMSAALYGRTDIVHILVAAGADASVANNFGDTAASLARHKGFHRTAEAIDRAVSAMTTLDRLEEAVLDMLLAGDHEILVALRAQAASARITSRRQTGAGFYCDFEIPPDVAAVRPRNFELGDVDATIDGLKYGAGFLLFVRDGRMSFLEGYSYQEDWPAEIRSFQLTYRTQVRELPRT